MTIGYDNYWNRVTHNLCSDCGKADPATPSKRCVDCLERVKEYNKNRRGKTHRSTPTPRQKRKVTASLLQAVALTKEDVEKYNATYTDSCN